jgi:hypothetical protein
MTRKEKILFDVELTNIIHGFINETHPKLVEELKPFVGEKIFKSDGSFLAKIKKQFKEDSLFQNGAKSVDLVFPENSIFTKGRVSYFFQYNGYSNAYVNYNVWCSNGEFSLNHNYSPWILSLGKGYDFLEDVNNDFKLMPILNVGDVFDTIQKLENLHNEFEKTYALLPETLKKYSPVHWR